jgi:hypothetical protein
MPSANPFPDYPVARLDDNASAAARSNFDTPATVEAGRLVDGYIAGWSGLAGPRQPLVVAVRGDYGSGKTHLLLYAADRFERGLGDGHPDAALLRVKAVDADPLGWYRAEIGPALAALSPRAPREPADAGGEPKHLRALALRAYAAAAQRVAGEAALTEAVSRKLESQPQTVLRLIRDGLINETAVEEAFREDLLRICPGPRDAVRLAITGLVRPETAPAALRWLRGEALPEHDLGLLRLSRPLASDEDAADVLAAVASLHDALGAPFGLLIDEAEHLLRPNAPEGRRNATWLKRLIEVLAERRTLVFVAGHDLAWEGSDDLLQRFSPANVLNLSPLTGQDVLRRILQPRLPGVTILPGVADAIAEAARGNVRRIFSLCHALHAKTEGFTVPPTPETVRSVAEALGQRVSKEEANLRFTDFLTAAGLAVRRDAVAGGASFDLAAYSDGKVRVVADFRHAITPRESHGEAWRFKDKLAEARRAEPQVIGCLVGAGSPDPDFFAALRADPAQRLLTFDLNRAEIFDRMRDELGGLLGDGARPAAAGGLADLREENERLLREIELARKQRDDPVTQQLKVQQAESERRLAALQMELARREATLEARLRELDEQRTAELRELQRRLMATLPTVNAGGDVRIITGPGEMDPRVHDVYRELVGRFNLGAAVLYALFSAIGQNQRTPNDEPIPPALVAMRLAFSPLFLLLYAVGSFGFGFIAGDLMRVADEAILARNVAYVLAGCFVLAAAWQFWGRVTRVGWFYERSARLLRQLYLGNATPYQLLTTYELCQDLLRRWGPRDGCRHLEDLSRQFDLSDARDGEAFIRMFRERVWK